jgi:hypothetical protein
MMMMFCYFVVLPMFLFSSVVLVYIGGLAFGDGGVVVYAHV